jgi:chorismate mutase
MADSTVRALRGATTVENDTPDEIHTATGELLTALLDANGLQPANVISALFSATPDVRSAYPAPAARAAGWSDVAMVCFQEMAVEGSLPRCIRVILHFAAPADRALKHVYLRGARGLRPDWQEK